MATLALGHTEVLDRLDALTLLPLLKEGFQAHSAGRTPLPHRAQSGWGHQEGATVLFPGHLPAIPAFSLTVATQHGTQGSRVLLLHDRGSGELLALMDADVLTGLTAALTHAVAADLLARPEATRVGVLGAGSDAVRLLKCLRLVRSLSQARFYDPDPAAAEQTAARVFSEIKLPTHPVASAEACVADADLVLVCLEAPTPQLHQPMLRPGAHVAVATPGLRPRIVGPSVLTDSLIFTDDRRLAMEIGVLSDTELPASAIRAELGELLSGAKPGRGEPASTTLFSPVGLPLTHLVAAWSVYQQARDRADVVKVNLHRPEP